MLNSHVKAYQAVEGATLTGRDLEASLLIKSAARLSAVQMQWDSPERDAMLDESLRYNQRLWTVFQSEMLEEANPLPKDVKNNILSLSLYVDKRTFETINAPAPEKLDILIAINRNIAAGLQNSPLQAAAA